MSCNLTLVAETKTKIRMTHSMKFKKREKDSTTEWQATIFFKPLIS